MKKPVLYVQASLHNKNKLAFDFCYSAKCGAEQNDIKVKSFQNIWEIPSEPTNIVVGSVEVCSMWLENGLGIEIPEQINLLQFEEFLGRKIKLTNINDISYPSFIKPANKIKAFTGFEATNKFYVEVFSEKYQGMVWEQEIVDIVGEYRMYINCKKIVGMKHYSGDCLVFPDGKFIQDCVDFSNSILDNHSYTLDFGVLENGSTILIEPNDGWAIGNYGIEPLDYYYFVRNRWLQITGIRTRVE